MLSGFILTYNYRRLDTFDKIWRFAVARFARLWPLHVATFVLAVLLLLDVRALFTPLGLGEAGLNLTLSHAFVPVLGFQFSYNSVSWSISAEWYFYTCFIGLIWLIGRPFSRLLPILIAGSIVMTSICLAMALPYYDQNPFALSDHTMIYLHPVARLPDFGIGMIAASVFLRFGSGVKATPPRYMTGLEILAILLTAGTATLTYSSFALVWPSAPPAILFWLERSGSAPVYALAIFILALERGHVSQWLSHPVMVLFGEISFAIYLLHQIILRWLAVHQAVVVSVPLPMAYGLFLAAVLSASWLAWRFIECPARARLRRWLANPPLRLSKVHARLPFATPSAAGVIIPQISPAEQVEQQRSTMSIVNARPRTSAAQL